jgi:hypothetical protein
MATALTQRRLVTDGDPDAPVKVPPASYFGDKEYADAPALERIAQALINCYAELGLLHEVRVRVLWRAKGGKTRGKVTLGKCQKPTGLLGLYADCDFLVWIAADHCRDYHLSAWQLEAALYHELLHITLDESDEDDAEERLVLRDHEFGGFLRELERYPDWHTDLRRMRETVQPELPWDTEADRLAQQADAIIDTGAAAADELGPDPPTADFGSLVEQKLTAAGIPFERDAVIRAAE